MFVSVLFVCYVLKGKKEIDYKVIKRNDAFNESMYSADKVNLKQLLEASTPINGM